MRGKVYSFGNVKDQVGITPAYAGKRELFIACIVKFWDHPRLCGEKITKRGTNNEYQGSPPPMRGKASCSGDFQIAAWITPAYAGKRLCVR